MAGLCERAGEAKFITGKFLYLRILSVDIILVNFIYKCFGHTLAGLTECLKKIIQYLGYSLGLPGGRLH